MWMERDKQGLILEGQVFTHEGLLDFLNGDVCRSDVEREDLWNFLRDWLDDSPWMTVHTSGSTGAPKFLQVRKDRMMNSARITCEFLGLVPGDSAYLCMPLQYIAGKMMVVRALVAGLNLIYRKPSGHPMVQIDCPLRFAAMVPMQVFNSMQTEAEKDKLRRVDNLIIGGGAVEDTLVRALQEMPGAIYSTYGMTETLSHIALRRLNGPDASGYYKPFPTVKVSLSPEETLVIEAPLVCEEKLVTNDIGRIFSDGTFMILGRKDNTVNSGGIKIQLEEVETCLTRILNFPFALTSIADERLGEALVLLVTENIPEEILKQNISEQVEDRYRYPKFIFYVREIPKTGSGKVDRAACRKLAEEQSRICGRK